MVLHRFHHSCNRLLRKSLNPASPLSGQPILLLRHGLLPANNGSDNNNNDLSNNKNNNNINQTTIRWHGDGPGPNAPTVNLTFIHPDDTPTTVSARVGETLLQCAHRTGIEMEGACEGVCACSTCHVILQQELYDQLLDGMEEGSLKEDEEDMLDMAFGLTHTSRLGCQIVVQESMEGGIFTLPKATRNFYVDGHKPTPH
jgi:ferredoxin